MLQTSGEGEASYGFLGVVGPETPACGPVLVQGQVFPCPWPHERSKDNMECVSTGYSGLMLEALPFSLQGHSSALENVPSS